VAAASDKAVGAFRTIGELSRETGLPQHILRYWETRFPQLKPLQRAGIANNVDLSTRRAANVVAYFRSQGVNPNILSAKGFGETHPVAPNDSPEGRSQNRRIEIVLEGPGA